MKPEDLADPQWMWLGGSLWDLRLRGLIEKYDMPSFVSGSQISLDVSISVYVPHDAYLPDVDAVFNEIDPNFKRGRQFGTQYKYWFTLTYL
jgi:hypothetical protein